MAERLLASAMQMALDSDSIDGVVIDPWTALPRWTARF